MTHDTVLPSRALAAFGLTLALAACGMKGPLRHPAPPAPPPADATLVAPPTVAPAPAPEAVPVPSSHN